ncbi:hypothetical protein RB195_021048 [Necator americanus]|uniref:Uncharacterized protein n=1 Tax=Necator americanus TaxID=51031 RepID=A0ABR1E9D2_NECAM
MTRGRYQYPERPSKLVTEDHLIFLLEEATWPKTEILDRRGERGPEDTRRGEGVQARRKVSQDMEWRRMA